MTPRERLLAEMWKADSRRPLTRLIELAEKAQDGGLTAEERQEFEEVTAENSRLFREYLAEISGKKESRP
jgi:uncharacterized protein YnzC (UPF0291/DUF896 family)